jgi:nucleoside-diphosphate-sugar epimerase
MKAGASESVIHLAAYYDFSGEPSPLYDEVTVAGTERLLRALRDFRVFSRTMLVHAPCQPGQHINEDWPLESKWDYPDSKVRTERLVMRARRDIPAVLLRIAGVYTDRCESAMAPTADVDVAARAQERERHQDTRGRSARTCAGSGMRPAIFPGLSCSSVPRRFSST